MKKKSRFLTGLLSAVMALSLFALPASAADGDNTVAAAKPMWSQDHGSITIHKYEWNSQNGEAATGENDASQLPHEDGENGTRIDPSPLKDAEFTLYEVMNADDLKAYYNGKTENTVSLDWKKYATKDETTGDYKLTASLKEVGKKRTDQNGEAVFDKVTVEGQEVDLPLGMYLVIETDSPDQVTTPCDPFLVSVPMTRVATDNKQADWLYDVHVYPKNKTNYGDITLEKKGQIGNGEQGANNLVGVTFKLFKFTGAGDVTKYKTTSVADKTWTEITASSTSKGDNTGTSFADKLTTNAQGKIEISGLSQGYYCFVEQDVSDVNRAYIVDQTPHYFEVKGENSQEFKFTEDGKVEATGTADANLTLTVVDPRPDVEKKVKGRVKTNESDDDYVKASDYSVGDEIPYKVTVKVPQALLNAKVEDASKFVFEVKDTPEHLEDKNVKAIGSTGTEVTEGVTITSDSEPNDKGGKGFTASFTQDALKALVGDNGDTFTITYTATLLKGADMTVNGNKNTINLKYSNKIDADGKINPGTSSEIEDGAVVYTFSIHVDKRGEKNDGDPLPGVKFNVYKKVAEGTPDAFKGSTIGITGEDKDNWFVKVVIDDKKNNDTKYDLVTGPEGKAQVDGLANGTYYLVETATVNGYNLLSGPVKVTIQVSYIKSWTVKNDYVDGKLVHQKETQYEEYFGGTKDALGNGYTLTTIINRKGFNLPTTGGFGTLLFSAIGALLVVGGVGVLMSTKKKKGNT